MVKSPKFPRKKFWAPLEGFLAQLTGEGDKKLNKRIENKSNI